MAHELLDLGVFLYIEPCRRVTSSRNFVTLTEHFLASRRVWFIRVGMVEIVRR